MANPRYEEFRNLGKQMVDFCCDYIKDLDNRPVMDTSIIEKGPGYLAPMLPTEAPEEPESFEKVMDDFNKKIMPGVLHWGHPNFYAYFGNGNAYPTILGDMLSSSTGLVGFSWVSCPSIPELEGIMLDWYARAMGLPEFFLSKHNNPSSIGGGSIQNSASDAIFAAMFGARKRATNEVRRNTPISEASFLSKLVAYASKEAHSCIEKAAMMNLVVFRAIEPDENDRMTGEALDKQIQKDIADGLTPFFVVATLGTTGQGEFDHLEQIGKVCQKYPTIWLHADGAYGGNALMLPEMRPAGLEYLESIEINPNKMMLLGFDCTALYVKDVVRFTNAFSIDPVYLQHEYDVIDLRHYGTPLSRRFRSLKFFFMFRLYGLDKIKAYIKRVIDMGHYLERLLKTDNRFEVYNRVHCGVVCFRLTGQTDKCQQEYLARLNASGRIWVIPALARGKYIIRIMASQEYVNEELLNRTFKTLQDIATEQLKVYSRSADAPKPMDPQIVERFSFTRRVARGAFEQEHKSKIPYDEAGKLLIVDE